MTEEQQKVADDFHRLFYDLAIDRCFGRGMIDDAPRWLGIPVQKYPMDLFILQEILFQTRPDLIIETGTADGGSAQFMASICDLLDNGRVVTIDVSNPEGRLGHHRVSYVHGDSTSDAVLARVRQYIRDNGKNERVMVVLDSAHHTEHVLSELCLYSQFVTVGNYLIVEDTNLGGNPVNKDFGPGPAPALEQFLRGNDSFVVDRSREKFLITTNPGGYLRRVR